MDDGWPKGKAEASELMGGSSTDVIQRFQQEHDWFWQEAHRIGENIREGLPVNLGGINPHLRMHQEFPDDIVDWLLYEP